MSRVVFSQAALNGTIRRKPKRTLAPERPTRISLRSSMSSWSSLLAELLLGVERLVAGHRATIAAGSAASADGLGDRELQPFERDADDVAPPGLVDAAGDRPGSRRTAGRRARANWRSTCVVTRTMVSQSALLRELGDRLRLAARRERAGVDAHDVLRLCAAESPPDSRRPPSGSPRRRASGRSRRRRASAPPTRGLSGPDRTTTASAPLGSGSSSVRRNHGTPMA